MKRGIVLLSLCVSLVSISLPVYAATHTHVMPSNPSVGDWEFIRVVNVRAGGTHVYPKSVDDLGNVLEWGRCTDTIYTEEYGLRCITCKEYGSYTTRERTEHNPQ